MCEKTTNENFLFTFVKTKQEVSLSNEVSNILKLYKKIDIWLMFPLTRKLSF